MGFVLPSPDSPREKARVLIERKDTLQTELDTQFAILSSHSSTMNSPLVDSDGFPRADIDVYAVRHARVRIIELRNDINAVMDDIAKALQSVHSNSASSSPSGPSVNSISSSHGASSGDRNIEEADLLPFARVDGVAPGSPAASAVSAQIQYYSLTECEQIKLVCDYRVY